MPTESGTTNQQTTIAQYINSQIDESQNPCDDFFSFACGSWNQVGKLCITIVTKSYFQKYSIPSYVSHYGVLYFVQENNDRVVAQALTERDSQASNSIRTTSMVCVCVCFLSCFKSNLCKVYQKCMESFQANTSYDDEILNLIKTDLKDGGLGGWPIIMPEWNAVTAEYLQNITLIGLFQSNLDIVTAIKGMVLLAVSNVYIFFRLRYR